MTKLSSSKSRPVSTAAPPTEPASTVEYTDEVLEQGHAAIALVAVIAAVLIAAAGYLCRLGFAENSKLEWAGYVGTSWFLVCFSFAVRYVLARCGVAFRNHWWTSHATLALIALSLSACLGMEQGTVTRTARALFFVVGAGTVAWLIVSRFHVARLKELAVLFGFAIWFALYAIGACWGTGYQNPTFVERICFGRAQIDTLYHATLANMLRTYGTPSTGLDGLPYILYHFGSNWLFGRLSNLLDVSVIDFYNRGYAVIFVPFGLFSFGTFALCMCPRWQTFREMADQFERVSAKATSAPSERTQMLGVRFWFVVLAAYVGLLPYSSGFLTAGGWNSVIVSESYSLAVAVSLLGIAAALAFFRNSYENPDLWAGDRILGLIALSAVSGAIGLLKVSVMLVLVAASGYLFLRVRPYLFRLAAAGTLLATSIVLAICAFAFTANPEYNVRSGFVPFGFLRENFDPQWWSYYWLVYYAWTWFFVATRTQEAGLHTFRDFATALREGRLLDLEFVVAVAIIGAGPGILLSGDSNSHYFSEYQRWIAAGFLLAILLRARNFGRPSDNKTWSARMSPAKVLMGIVVLTVAGTMVSNTLVLLDGTVGAALASRGLAWANADARGKLLDHGIPSLLRTAESAAAVVQRRLETDKNILTVLRSLDRLPLSEKRHSLIYIPKSNTHYWDLLHGPYSPKDAPFVAPALSGIAMIDGLYERPEGDFWSGYGYQHYPMPIENRKRPPLDQYLPVLRQRCAKMGFSQLIVITSAPNGISEARKYDCR